MVWETAIEGFVAGAILALTLAFKKTQKPRNPENIKLEKLLSTAIFGGIIGLMAGANGATVDTGVLVQQMTTYAGLGLSIESGVKFVWRYIENRIG